MEKKKSFSVSLTTADRGKIERLSKALGKRFGMPFADAQVVRYALSELAKKESVSLR